MTGPLAGIRVVEVSTMAFVPGAAAVLADWGAEVIKVEHPVHGDLSRGVLVHGLPLEVWGEGFHVMWESPNRGKRSIGLDLALPEGRVVLDELLDTADVFLTNFLPDTREKLHLRAEDIRARNPRTVYALGTGYGTKGDLAARGGYDLVCFWSRGGIAHESRQPGDSRPTPLPGPGFGDMTSGHHLAGGIAAALLRRERTGEAATVDVSLLGAGLWSLQMNISAADLLDAEQIPHPGREQTHNPLILAYRTCDDRYIGLSMTRSDLFWKGFCIALGHPELAEDPRFLDMHARARHAPACIAILDAVFATRTLAEWVAALATQDGPFDVVQTPREVLADPQVIANGLVQEVDYGGGRTARLVPSPVHFDDRPAALGPAPALGANTEEILLELGRSWEQIVALKQRGAVN